MKSSVLFRKIHYWGAIVVLVPALIVISTGILLQVKKHWAWVQPPEQKGSGKVPSIPFEAILAACQGVPEAEIRTWADIARIDVRPSKGVLKVTAKNDQEIQIDSATGEVLQVAYRRSDWIEAMHDGSWFHEWAKLGLFLPAAVILLILALTGGYLFFLPLWVKWRRRRRGAVQNPTPVG